MRDNHIEENTLFVFTSDNGPWLVMQENGGSAGALKDGKGTWWEGGFRVPAVFSMPGTIVPRVSDEIMTTMDIFPTFLAMAGIPMSKDVVLDGVDQRAFLLEEKNSARDEIYYWWGSELMAVRKGKWKYYLKTIVNQYLPTCVIETPKKPLLYNLEIDVSERYNKAEQYPEIVNQLIEVANLHKKNMVVKPSVCDLSD